MTEAKFQKIKEAIRDGRLVQDAGGITSTLTQSDKLGFDWKNIYVNDVLVRRDYIEQKVKRGTAENPIAWESGMELIQNAYYIHDGSTKVWMGEAGATAAWDDEGFAEM